MFAHVGLKDGLLPDEYGKFAPERCRLKGQPVCSFPIEIGEVPEGTQTLALAFLDWDAIPVGGFCWIHWLACNIDPACTLIPENASQTGEVDMVQGANSNWSPFLDRENDPALIYRYTGPCPPDKMHTYTLYVFALDCALDVEEGYYLNAFRRAIANHVLEQVTLELPSRAS